MNRKVGEILILDRVFAIYLDSDTEVTGHSDTPSLGMIHYVDQKIHVSSALRPTQFWRTLAHEITHEALRASGVEFLLPEGSVEAICNSVSLVFGPILHQAGGLDEEPDSCQ